MQLLKLKVKGPFVVMFDESLNHKLQEKQMDLLLRYWDEERHRVVTRYYTSEFMGHATADDMVKHFTTCILESGLRMAHMVQISMDGPNVNWCFNDIIKQTMISDHDNKLINIGSCGLHILHNSFKTGAESTGWQVSSFLASLYYLFKDAPARKEDYCKVTQSSLLPLKFVNHRWLENTPVCERAIEILQKVGAYVKAVHEKKVTNPNNKSFETISFCVKDKLFLAKLQFFKSIATILQPFLTLYQSDKPMICFLSDDLCMLLRSLMRKFVKSDCLDVSDEKVAKLNIEDKSIHVHLSKIDLGFSCENILKQKNIASEKQILEFRAECKNFLIQMLKKILLKCPVSYSLVRHLSCLNPVNMASNKDDCKGKFKKVLTVMSNANKIQESECDVVLEQYYSFLDNIPSLGSVKFTSFDKKNDSVDILFHDCMSCSDKYTELYKFLKLVLVLSHGQAGVERGFSVNRQVEVENMKHETLVAQRVICDHVKTVGGILNVELSKKLLLSCKMERQKYDQYLESEREKRKSVAEKRKRKDLLDEIEEIKKKKKRMESDILSLTKSADSLYEKVEVTGKMEFVAQANSFKRTVKDKKV